MTYPPPGGYDPQQYHVSNPPQQPPGDPYAQGYNAQPPPPGYSQPQYGQQPNMTPPMGVQPGYPPGTSSTLPPPIPPANQGGNLGLILGVIVGLVVLLGVAAVLIVPGLLEDDDNEAGGGDDSTSEEASEEETEEEEPPPDDEETGDGGDTGGSFEDWGTPISSQDSYDTSTPEGAAITWVVAADLGDTDTLDSLLCSSPSSAMQSEYEWEVDYGGEGYEFIIWGMSRESGGQTQAWADWTWTDEAPTESDVYSGYVMVEEDGGWKLCDIFYP